MKREINEQFLYVLFYRKDESKLEINEGFREELKKASEDEFEEETVYPYVFVSTKYSYCLCGNLNFKKYIKCRFTVISGL